MKTACSLFKQIVWMLKFSINISCDVLQCRMQFGEKLQLGSNVLHCVLQSLMHGLTFITKLLKHPKNKMVRVPVMQCSLMRVVNM